MSKIYDLIIIGSGPAGLTAGIYALRARLDTLMIEMAGMSGGQIINTNEIDNYPGMPGISGIDLALKMRSHYDGQGGKCIDAEVCGISAEQETSDAVTASDLPTRADASETESAPTKTASLECRPIWRVSLADGTSLLSRAVIIATGAAHRKLGVPGEQSFAGSGVSYCATCDGAFFRNRTVAVVGGGDVALEDALFLSRICKKVYVIHRRGTFRGAPVLAERLEAADNVTILWHTIVTAIEGSDVVERLRLRGTASHSGESLSSDSRSENVLNTDSRGKDIPVVDSLREGVLEIDGVFIAVGMDPVSAAFRDTVACDDSGYIIAGENCETSVAGIFAAGDVRTKPLRQIVGAAADGACAVYSAQKYLLENG